MPDLLSWPLMCAEAARLLSRHARDACWYTWEATWWIDLKCGDPLHPMRDEPQVISYVETWGWAKYGQPARGYY